MRGLRWRCWAGTDLTQENRRSREFLISCSLVEPSIREEEDQIDPGSLHATLRETVRRGARFGSGRRLHPQELRELVFDHEFREAPLPELLTEPDEGLVAHLFPECDAASGLTRLRIRCRD